MYKFAIVEDDQAYAEQLNAYVSKYAKANGLEIETECFCSGLDFISDYKPNFQAVFMDIEMPHMNGMETAIKLREMDQKVNIIFVTNMVQYAVKGYEVDAMSYVVKPVDYFAFSVVMDKLASRLGGEPTKEIIIKCNGLLKKIAVEKIHYVEVLDHYLVYHTDEGEFKELGKLQKAEDELSAYGFFRSSNCFLVNLRCVSEVSENDVKVGKDTVMISRRRRKDFLTALNDFFAKGGN